jgi:hypothetical protein
MLDIFNIPGQQDNVKVFYASDTNAWQTWQKPRNCKFIWMMCIGGAAGGGGGQSGVANPPTTYSPGGGGCSAAVTRAIFPANVLPDILYIQPGPGGAGGAAGGQSSGGNRSFVVINPSGSIPAVMNTVCVSGTAAAAGTLTNTGETAATVAAAGLLSLGNFISIAGGASGGQVDVTPLSGTITSVGTAGGQASIVSGGNSNTILSTTLNPSLQGAGSTTTTNNGFSFTSWKPFFTTGGCGGGGFGANAGNGGKGGDGGFGSGGGGGGAAFNGTGGVGGKGGDGLVIIATF